MLKIRITIASCALMFAVLYVGASSVEVLPPLPPVQDVAIDEPLSKPVAKVALSENTVLSPRAHLEAQISSYIMAGHMKGLSYGVWKDGTPWFYHHDGISQIAGEAPIEDDTIFRIYSMTKPVTAVAMMILHERGVWDFDDPIEKHLPILSNVKVLKKTKDGQSILVKPAAPPTMRQLMNHTAGFGYGLSDTHPVDAHYQKTRVLESHTHQALIHKIAAAPLMFDPGSDWNYSIASDIQGALVEAWTGQPLSAFMYAEIFKPLGMKDTGFWVPEDKQDRFSDVFVVRNGSEKLVKLSDWDKRFTLDTVRRHKGGGGLVSTQKDFAKFIQLLRQNGEWDGVQILSVDSIIELTRNQLPENVGMWALTNRQGRSAPGHTYGLSVGIISDPILANLPFGKGTIYWSGIAGTWFWYDIQNDVFAIGMMQRYDTPQTPNIDFARELARLTYVALDADPAHNTAPIASVEAHHHILAGHNDRSLN